MLGVLWMKTSLCVNASSRVPQPNRCHTPAVGTRQPFGLPSRDCFGVSSAHWAVGTRQPFGSPVEPEVYMTYITSGGDHDTGSRASPMSARRRS